MPKNKTIAKGCPKCEQQVPVACKACPCGHSFFNARRNQRSLSPADDSRRRTQRVRREKPNYYDVLEYDKQLKRQIRSRNSECDNDEEKRDVQKPKKRKVKKDDDDEDDIVINISPEKQQKCAVILAEINRRMQSVMWKQS